MYKLNVPLYLYFILVDYIAYSFRAGIFLVVPKKVFFCVTTRVLLC